MKEKETKSRTYNRKKLTLVFCVCVLMLVGLVARLVRLMVYEADYYQELAEDLHQRERSIKAARGRILDRNGTVLASNRTVCTVSVVHSQLTDPEAVITALSRELNLPDEQVRGRVEKYSSIERIKANVDKETGDRIRCPGTGRCEN